MMVVGELRLMFSGNCGSEKYFVVWKFNLIAIACLLAESEFMLIY